jgi:hypothetical protein
MNSTEVKRKMTGLKILVWLLVKVTMVLYTAFFAALVYSVCVAGAPSVGAVFTSVWLFTVVIVSTKEIEYYDSI